MLKKIVPLISSLLGIVICSEVEVLLAEETKFRFLFINGEVLIELSTIMIFIYYLIFCF